MASFTSSSTGTTTGTATLSSLSTVGYDRTVYINVEGNQQKSWQIAANVTPNSSYSASFTGLSPNTVYQARCTVYRNSPWESVYNETSNFKTNMPSLSTPAIQSDYTEKTTNSIVLKVNSANATYYYMTCGIGSTVQQAKDNSSGLFTFTGLSPSTTYTFRYYATASGYENSPIGSATATTSDKPLIIEWEWLYPKTGMDLRPHVNEWLAFCNKINEVRVAKGLSAYSFTTSTTYIDKDKPFYAWIWLQAANAINQINGQVASACLNVNSKSDIYPWYFDNLKTALNNAISS